MNICKHCQKEFIPQKGLKNFCSIECRSSRVISSEQRERHRAFMKDRVAKIKQDPEKYLEWRKNSSKPKKFLKRDYTESDFDSVKWDLKRKIILKSQNDCCAKCKNKDWFGSPLTLEIDHINGDHTDNRRENLVALCPNCHSITPSWRGRNKRTCNRVSNETAIEALKSEPSIRQALIKCGLSPKGGNYKRFSTLKESIDGGEALR